MPRNPTAPPLPNNPATWLANFRYRLAGEHGERLSPESLGFRLGVSGATIRRWESGQANPSEGDLARFAEVCRLSPQQREFVLRLFARGGVSVTGEPANFRREAATVLSIQECACLVDELFYIRAWNDIFEEHVGHFATRLPEGISTIDVALATGQMRDPDRENLRVRSIVRQMWMWTAHLAAFPAYSTLVDNLLRHEQFSKHWQAIVEESGEDGSTPLVMPANGESDSGGYTVHAGEVLFPPLYRIFICVPETSIDGGTSRTSPPKVHFADRLHWSD